MKFVDAKKSERSKRNGNYLYSRRENITYFTKVETAKHTHDIKKMIIHVGGNHIPHESPDSVMLKLQQMLTKIRTIMPNTKLYYSLVLPRINDNCIPGINKINRGITSFCDNGISVIHHSNFGNNGSINCHLFRKDIIHPNFKWTSTNIIYIRIEIMTRNTPRVGKF